MASHIRSICQTVREYVTSHQVLDTKRIFRIAKDVVEILVLMFVVLTIFAMAGHYLFGDPSTGDPENWGDFGSALSTVFILSTSESWTDIQQKLDDLGMNNSRLFTIVIVFTGCIFYSMFKAVIAIELANKDDWSKAETKTIREESLTKRKWIITEQQRQELKEKYQAFNHRSFNDRVEEFKTSLRHDRYIEVKSVCTSRPFIDIYLRTLDHQANNVKELQQLYGEVMDVLREELENKLNSEEKGK